MRIRTNGYFESISLGNFGFSSTNYYCCSVFNTYQYGKIVKSPTFIKEISR